MRVPVLLLLFLSFPCAVAVARDEPLPLRVRAHLGAMAMVEDGAKSSQESSRWVAEAAVSVIAAGCIESGLSGAWGLQDDPTTEHLMLWGRYRWSVPVVTPFLGLGLGYLWKENVDDDAIFSDDGFTGQVEAGAEANMIGGLSIALRGAILLLQSDAHERNPTYPAYVPIWRAGVQLVYEFL